MTRCPEQTWQHGSCPPLPPTHTSHSTSPLHRPGGPCWEGVVRAGAHCSVETLLPRCALSSSLCPPPLGGPAPAVPAARD